MLRLTYISIDGTGLLLRHNGPSFCHADHSASVHNTVTKRMREISPHRVNSPIRRSKICYMTVSDSYMLDISPS